jgi:hypothetical protein
MFRVGLGVLLGVALQSWAIGAVLQLDATRLFEQSVTRDVQLTEANSEVELATGELFEDDGPAAGHSYQKPENRERLSVQTWIKKELVIPNPQARTAYLVVLSSEPFETEINGRSLVLATNKSGRQLHQAYEFDPALLRAGTNEIVLEGAGSVLIARDDEFALGSRTRTRHPNRSAKSTDAGKTWDYDHLGPDGKLDGEYGVRVFLEHYRSAGTLVTPVLDMGNLEGRVIAAPVSRTGPIRITVTGESGGGTGRILVRARSGDTFVPSEEGWSPWRTLGEAGGVLEEPRGRYLQIAVELSSGNALRSPKLKGLRVEAAPTGPTDWTAGIRVLEEHNEEIVRTSIPFEYEPFDHPRLKRLREQFKLDELTRGAKSELDVMLRLAQWACNYWDWPNHIGERYPAWDALEILKPYGDGQPVGGFCQQFNVVFLQACESFGIPGRAISISQGRWQQRYPGAGHEIVELWSNEWKKWVYVDGALAWYIVDTATGAPLSMLELRERQLPTLRGRPVGQVQVVSAERTKNKQFRWQGLAAPEPLNWYLELRMIPRSNFLQESSPLPLNQGTEEWSWAGHYVWTDAEVPAGWLFGNRVDKRGNFEWTLNQAHYVLEPEGPGRLRVHLDTETPGFACFLAEIDGGDKRQVATGFTWALHSGNNQLRVRPRNLAGREGIPSWITLEYATPLRPR